MGSAAIHHHASPRRSSSSRRIRFRREAIESFWATVAVLLGLAAFFVITGAISPFASPAATIVFGTLVGLWAFHVFEYRHEHPDHRDRDIRMRQARERRGF